MEGATFKEYIREELAVYSENMSRDMQTKFGFVNIAGNAFHDIELGGFDGGGTIKKRRGGLAGNCMWNDTLQFRMTQNTVCSDGDGSRDRVDVRVQYSTAAWGSVGSIVMARSVNGRPLDTSDRPTRPFGGGGQQPPL